MRCQQRKGRKYFRGMHALAILSHVAAIIGTLVALMDVLHHW
jgi:hypothetical protein